MTTVAETAEVVRPPQQGVELAHLTLADPFGRRDPIRIGIQARAGCGSP